MKVCIDWFYILSSSSQSRFMKTKEGIGNQRYKERRKEKILDRRTKVEVQSQVLDHKSDPHLSFLKMTMQWMIHCEADTVMGDPWTTIFCVGTAQTNSFIWKAATKVSFWDHLKCDYSSFNKVLRRQSVVSWETAYFLDHDRDHLLAIFIMRSQHWCSAAGRNCNGQFIANAFVLCLGENYDAYEPTSNFNKQSSCNAFLLRVS